MAELDSWLRTEAKVRRANDDGIYELLDEAANEIERLRSALKETVMSKPMESKQIGMTDLEKVELAARRAANYLSQAKWCNVNGWYLEGALKEFADQLLKIIQEDKPS